jgi:site-specific DNA recombinase
MNKRAVIYARTSYDDRDTDGRNLAGQLEMGREYCRKKVYTVVAEMAEDSRGASGAEINLPQLNKTLEMAKNGLLDVLVVRELDRLSRDVGKLYIVEKELRRYKVNIEYVLTDFPQTPAGQLMKNIYASFAQFERDEIRLRMMRGKRNKVNNGPYGYDKYVDGQFILLKPNAVEAEIVKQIFRWYVVEQAQIAEIARRLDAMHAPLPDAHVRQRKNGWSMTSIRRILHNPEYFGEWNYTYDKNEKITVNIPPIIDQDLWEGAQTLLEENKAFRKQVTKYDYLFERRLTCGKCGRKMACVGQHMAGKMYLYYACKGAKHDWHDSCKGYAVRADLVDGLAWTWISTILKDPEKLRSEIDVFQTRAQRENAPALDQMRIVDDLLAENRSKLQRLVDLYMSGSFALEDLQERKNRLEQTIHSLEDQRANLVARLEGQTLTTNQVDELQAFAAEIRAKLDSASHAEKLQLFNILNVKGSLTIEKSGKVLNIQCIIRTQPDKFILQNSPTHQ